MTQEASDRRCWHCRRDLGVSVAPRAEEIVLCCPRCGEFTVVQYGRPARAATPLEVAAGVQERREYLSV